MISLSKGLVLEDSGAIVPWNCSQETAWSIGGSTPTNGKAEDRSRMAWTGKMLGGLDCFACSYIPDGETFRSISVTMILSKDCYPNQPWYAYMKFFDHFFQCIGTPEIRASAGTLYAPILSWRHDGCCIQVYTGERFGDFTTCEVTLGSSGRFK